MSKMKTKDVVMYVRNVSLMKFTKPVSTLVPRPANEITHYRPPKKDIVPVTKPFANADATEDADNDAETYRYYLL